MTLPKVIEEAQILSHEAPIAGVDILTLASPLIAQSALPGQFVQISVPADAAICAVPSVLQRFRAKPVGYA